LCAVSLLLAAASDHTLNVCAIAVALAFAIGTYGHIQHSKTLILTAIFAIACICLYFVASGEVATFN
jgi:hypothetical protein